MSQSTANTQAVPTGSPQTGSYVTRALSFTITLGKGAFGSSGSNTVTLANLRAHVSIQCWGIPSLSKAEIDIYGVTPDIMNQVSTLGMPVGVMVRNNNTITILAGDEINGMAQIFQADIINAWQNLQTQPDTLLQIIAYGGKVNDLIPVPPISFQGSLNVATAMAGLANTMGYQFENGGVNTTLPGGYFAGSARQQAIKLAKAANIELYFDQKGPTLAIWPKLGTRAGVIPLISPDSGLINYPIFTGGGLKFRCLFNPNITKGGKIQMQSSYAQANGLWYVTDLTYDLSSQIHRGPWFCDVGCVNQSDLVTTR